MNGFISKLNSLILHPRFIGGVLIGGVLSIAMCWGVVELIPNRSVNQSFIRSNVKSDINSMPRGRLRANDTLQAILTMEGPMQRKRYVNELLGSLNTDEIVDLITASKVFKDSRKLSATQNIVFDTLARSDPTTALKNVWDMESHRWRDLIRVVFGAWSLTDTNAALDSATTLEAPFREEAIKAVLSKRVDLLATELMELARSHQVESTAQQIITRSKMFRLVEEPELAIQLVAESNFDTESQLDILMLFFDMLNHKEGFDQVLNQLTTLHSTYGQVTELLDDLVRDIARADPKKTWEYLLTMSPEPQDQLHYGILDAWGESDPHEALLALSKVENPDALDLAIDGILAGWVRTNPTELLNNLQLIPKQYRDSAIRSAVVELVQSGAADKAGQHMRELKSQGELADRTVSSFMYAWAPKNPTTAVEWILANTETKDSLRGRLLSIALPELALLNPIEAMKISIEQTSDGTNSFERLEARVVRALALNKRFDEAKDLLRIVREPERLEAYVDLGSGFIEFGESDRVFELAQELSASDRKRFFGRITATWLTLEPDHLMASLASLPDQDSRSQVALNIVALSDVIQNLTLEQIEYARNFIRWPEEN